MSENVQAALPPMGPPKLPSLRSLGPDLLIDAALPAIAYQVLSRHGVADVPALTAGAIFPAANIARNYGRAAYERGMREAALAASQPAA